VAVTIDRPVVLAVVERVSASEQTALREALPEHLVVMCTVEDAPAVVRSFQIALVLVVGPIELPRSLWTELEQRELAPLSVAFATTLALAARAIERLTPRTLRVPSNRARRT
jgi:hypothetical protein